MDTSFFMIQKFECQNAAKSRARYISELEAKIEPPEATTTWEGVLLGSPTPLAMSRAKCRRSELGGASEGGRPGKAVESIGEIL